MSANTIDLPTKPQRSILDWISQHWFSTFLVIYGLWIWIPFLAPVFMKLGLDGAGNVIYFVYSFFCHQLPERSLFFFGDQSMHSLREIQAAWQNTDNPMILRKFVGNETMGWKVAWSDRMISFYGGVWVSGLLWWPLRRKLSPLSWWAFAVLLLPMLVDGSTHAISDLAGIGSGFRDTNQWLVTLTNGLFPPSFYAGDALGSFNSWVRLITGLLAGLGIVWLTFPHLYRSMNETLRRSKRVEAAP